MIARLSWWLSSKMAKLSLTDASDELRGTDHGIVLTAPKQNGDSLRFVKGELRDDPEVLKEAVSEAKWSGIDICSNRPKNK